jgi:hypothetical protein
MNTRHAFRRFAALAFAMALFALTASSSFAFPLDPSDQDPQAIIIVGG